MCISHNLISSSNLYHTGLIFNSWHMFYTERGYHLNKERWNYEINIIMWKIKQMMEHILKLQ